MKDQERIEADLIDHLLHDHLVQQRWIDEQTPAQLAAWHDLDHRTFPEPHHKEQR